MTKYLFLACPLFALASCATYTPAAEPEVESVGPVEVGSGLWLGGRSTDISRPDSGEGALGEAEAARRGGTPAEAGAR